MRHAPGDLPAGFPAVILVGTFDDPSQFVPQMVIYTVDKQAFHHVPGRHACVRTVARAVIGEALSFGLRRDQSTVGK